MKIRYLYSRREDIPSGDIADLFELKDGKYVFTALEGGVVGRGEFEAKEKELKAAEDRLNVRAIEDVLKAACTEEGIANESIIEDVLVFGTRLFELVDGQCFTREGVGVAPGQRPKHWLQDMRKRRPHWWSTPGTGNDKNGQMQTNPWKKDTFNLTEQGRIARDNPDLAKKLKAQAGIA